MPEGDDVGECGGFDIRFSIAASPHSECQTQNRTTIIFYECPFGSDLCTRAR
jgi:hypothetical protein